MKKCTKCLADKKDEDFSWKIKSKGIKQSQCKKCVSESINKHYLADKDKYLKKARINNRAYKKRNKDFISDYLKDKCCVDCGNNNPIVLDFDHVKGKKRGNIGRLKIGANSIKYLQEEIDKCEIRCSNCHRIKTHERRNMGQWSG